MIPTLKTALDDWEVAGPYARRKDAAPNNPSPLLSVADLLALVKALLKETP